MIRSTLCLCYHEKSKASRSHVIKAGLLALRQMPKSEAIAFLAKVTGSEVTEDIENIRYFLYMLCIRYAAYA